MQHHQIIIQLDIIPCESVETLNQAVSELQRIIIELSHTLQGVTTQNSNESRNDTESKSNDLYHMLPPSSLYVTSSDKIENQEKDGSLAQVIMTEPKKAMYRIPLACYACPRNAICISHNCEASVIWAKR